MNGYAVDLGLPPVRVPVGLPRRSRIVSPREWLREKIEDQRRERESTIVAAVAVVQSNHSTGGGNNSTITTSAFGSGTLVGSFFAQSNANTPTAVAGIGSPLTVHATTATYNSGAGRIFFAVGAVVAGQSGITWSPGASATGNGVCGWELSGVSTTHDITPVHTDSLTATSISTPTVTTLTPGAIVLMGCGANVSSGTIGAWTGTNVATTTGGPTTGRCFGGSFITTVTISSVFTANYSTSGNRGILAVVLQPPAATTMKRRLIQSSRSVISRAASR